jgi:hypothetical protein
MTVAVVATEVGVGTQKILVKKLKNKDNIE